MALVYVNGENGLLAGVWEESVLPDGIAHRLGTGDLTRVTADGSPWEPGGGDDSPPPDAPELPKRTASRGEWHEFAVSQGMHPDEAAVKTKAELVGEFTKAG